MRKTPWRHERQNPWHQNTNPDRNADLHPCQGAFSALTTAYKRHHLPQGAGKRPTFPKVIKLLRIERRVPGVGISIRLNVRERGGQNLYKEVFFWVGRLGRMGQKKYSKKRPEKSFKGGGRRMPRNKESPKIGRRWPKKRRWSLGIRERVVRGHYPVVGAEPGFVVFSVPRKESGGHGGGGTPLSGELQTGKKKVVFFQPSKKTRKKK